MKKVVFLCGTAEKEIKRHGSAGVLPGLLRTAAERGQVQLTTKNRCQAEHPPRQRLPHACCAFRATTCATPVTWFCQTKHRRQAEHPPRQRLPYACCAFRATTCATPATQFPNHADSGRRDDRAQGRRQIKASAREWTQVLDRARVRRFDKRLRARARRPSICAHHIKYCASTSMAISMLRGRGRWRAKTRMASRMVFKPVPRMVMM